MSRPSPLSSAADHERHDALLVAQFVAGDPLEQDQRAAAQRLVGSCGSCAALAADLQAVSAAVASEPVPPRRRDFRLRPEQAEELSGGALTRFLRGLSLPSARAFQPAAAGVLSVGLLFMVAGYAWPDDGSMMVQAEPNLVTYAETAAPPAAAVEPAADAAIESLQADPEFMESLPRHQAGTSERATQKSLVSEMEAPDQDAELMAGEAGLMAPAEDSAELDAAPAEMADADVAADARSAGTADAVEESMADDLVSESAVGLQEPDATSATGAPAAGGADVLATFDEGGPEDLLLIVGLLLALGGGGLLLLGWLARRSRDPLLR